jgi:hypothetical protein
MKASKTLVRCGLTIAVALVAACASKPTIRTNVDPAADFAKFQTYGFFDEVTGRAPAYESFATRYIKTAIDSEMQKRGLQKSGNPQLLVNTHVKTKDKVQVTETPSGYYGYRYGMYGWGAGVSSTNVDNYTEGTLNIDVIDAATSRLVWEGVAVGRISEKARDNPQPAIDAVVQDVFEKFPRQPAQAPKT